MMRNNDVTAMVIFEALAWAICGSALLIGIIKYIG